MISADSFYQEVSSYEKRVFDRAVEQSMSEVMTAITQKVAEWKNDTRSTDTNFPNEFRIYQNSKQREVLQHVADLLHEQGYEAVADEDQDENYKWIKINLRKK